jgi:hypothetical protein
MPARVQEPKPKLIAITVKLEPELYEELKRVGLQTQPATSSQAIMVEALKAYLQQRRATDEGS